MPVQDSQALPTDQPVDEEANVPEQTTEEVSAEAEQPKEETFTRAEVEAMLADFEEKKVKPLIQSQVAKSENRTSLRIQERFQALEGVRATLNLTDEQVSAAQDAIIREEQKNEFKPQRPMGNGDQAPAAGPEEMGRQFQSVVSNIYQEEGVEVATTDKEWIEIVKPVWEDPNSTPLNTLFAVKQAAVAKKAKLTALKGNAKARTQGGGERPSDSSNISTITDSATLYELGDKQIREKNRR